MKTSNGISIQDFAAGSRFTMNADGTVIFTDTLRLAGHEFDAELTYTDDSNFSMRVVKAPEGFYELSYVAVDRVLSGIEKILIRDMKGHLVSEAINAGSSAARQLA